jgi:hypothetical protein
LVIRISTVAHEIEEAGRVIPWVEHLDARVKSRLARVLVDPVVKYREVPPG